MWQPEQPSSQQVPSRSFSITVPPRIAVRRLTTWPCLVISSTPQPFSAMAPVGQACTHLPQLVQVCASPHGRLSSLTSRDWMPRAAMSQTCAPSISAQARTQREHRTQRLWSRTKRGWVVSTGRRG